MKKYSLIYAISFISYTACLSVMEYITARTFADIIFCVFLLCCVYELAYLFYFRKKDNVSFGRAFARLFQYGLLALWLWVAIYFVWGSLYYGVEVWTQDPWGRLIFWAITIPTAIYNFAYYTISKKLKNIE